MEQVIIELIVAEDLSGDDLQNTIGDLLPGAELDPGYEPVEITPRDQDRTLVGSGRRVVVVRGRVSPEQKQELSERPEVLHVWSDGRVMPFAGDPGEP